MDSQAVQESIPAMNKHPWTILLVDDEEDVIEVSKLVLEDLDFDGLPLRILSARTAKDAREIFDSENDIALALIDVVMETEHAGLDLVRYVREKLGNQNTRLILRTGNPGAAPQREIVRHLEIDDYKEKTDLTADRLETTVLTSLRSYRNIKIRLRMERGLEQMLDASSSLHSSVSTLEFLRIALKEITTIVQVEYDSELNNGALVLQRLSDGFKVVSGPDAIDFDVPQTKIDEAPSSLLEELRSIEHTEGIVQVKSGVVFTVTARAGQTYHFWIGTPFQLPSDSIRLLQFFLSKLSVSLSNSILRREVLDAQSDVMNRLCEAVESRSKETGSHIRRIALYSRKLARLTGLSEGDIELITVASPMHDIGKVAIPDSILNKPGKLDPQQWEVMKTHAHEGFRLLAHPHFSVMQAGAEIAKTHHERWDGSGYPLGLVGQQIPIMGRIVALVDVFDALLSRRPYKEPWPLEKVAEEIRSLRGKQFDPDLTDIFLNHIDDFHEIFTQFPD